MNLIQKHINDIYGLQFRVCHSCQLKNVAMECVSARDGLANLPTPLEMNV